MEGTLLPLSSPTPTKPNNNFILFQRFTFPSSLNHFQKTLSTPKRTVLTASSRNSHRSSALALHETASVSEKTDASSFAASALPKIDKTGRFCSPRAARELALSIIYASCLEGLDPVRLFEKRMNERREPGYDFDKEKLLKYNHMSFGGPPVTVESVEEENELLSDIEKESAVEAEVLAAPPKLVYNKLILRFTRKLLVAARDRWDANVDVINEIVPQNWKNEPAGRILELSILHLAMSEMTVLDTRHQIVINEAVDLAKRFCDGAAPRIINGCLRTFVQGLELGASETEFS
ncbi:hypothetical protein HN51_065897 [Arachis hypogaea]|uniref:NusB/RsmB/TIM44 domain-containing protein n=2 Tax=Arachis hypogaea TaxID=3818 RepID=A0A445DHB1_ARAHY|nr:uncharacterized protein LOC107639148 isoform X2 [Arachis ipaensis]XP_025646898.1 uncharacterized protein LOC112741926 isoform X2 [Arachis hypogaea]XP_057757140.1 uncharacterized protein LOC130976320 [Arachis stenosperma]QHO07174.1 uncharacterized protein DS421_14g461300 [Arachis hypogaea]QHO38332.1 uncharacterized protein DS421_4g119440 [Arachis hypogaea]RYR13677.1 hypothetical protein Ahy_B04g070543 isoform A [Arachis hypogaea]RYR62607.1 hypothetical protein Ahy_A04g020316 [Arachis hypoga